MALMPFADVGQQPRVARQQQISVGLVFVATHAAAQLIEIAQAKTIGAIDDDRVRVGNIEAAFDDRGGEQNVGFAVDEFRHHFFQIVGIHLAVADDDARRAAPASGVFGATVSMSITRLCR